MQEGTQVDNKELVHKGQVVEIIRQGGEQVMNREHEPICEYALTGTEVSATYPYPYRCAVMFECRHGHPTQKMAKNCPRKQIGDNMRREA